MVSSRLRLAHLLLLTAPLVAWMAGCGGNNATAKNSPEARNAFMGSTPPPEALAKMKAGSQAGVTPPAK